MAIEDPTTSKSTGEPGRQQLTVSVKPGTKIQLTIEAGAANAAGEVPLTIHVEQVADSAGEPAFQVVGTAHPEPTPAAPAITLQPVPQNRVKPQRRLTLPAWPIPSFRAGRLAPALASIQRRLKISDLATLLFILATVTYLLTRLVGLEKFPIYFFTDEAVQSQTIVELAQNGFRDTEGTLLPTYFKNGVYSNLSASVYLQGLPALLFGKSAVVTRATSVFVTLIAVFSIAAILRDIFKLKYWWAGVLILSITPAWFLHSRTAFETAEFVAFYAGMLCLYLFYRYNSPRYLYPAAILGALAFYTYSPAQAIVPLTVLLLALSDWRYHWQNRRTVGFSLLLALVLALPYARYNLSNPSVPFAHLHRLFSYWFEDISLAEKLRIYFAEYGFGLSPWYWYVPNDRDLARHLMKDYGNIIVYTLPFLLLGLVHLLRSLRSPASRAVLIALLASPAGAALVETSITRVLVLVIPAAILTAIGLERFLLWLEDPAARLQEGSEESGPTARRVIASLLVLAGGMALAFRSAEPINRVALSAVTALLALLASGILEWLARRLQQVDLPRRLGFWKIPTAALALPVFLLLAGTNLFMLGDSLRNGPLWFKDYGLGGMQYGAFQVFDAVEQYIEDHPGSQVILSADWANGADMLARFFLGEPPYFKVGSARGYLTQKLPLNENTLFVMTPEEYNLVLDSDRLTNVQVEQVVPFPDGEPGFYFARMEYVEDIDEIFAREKAARTALRETVVRLDGQDVKVRFSYLDADFQDEYLRLVFDGDPFTVAKTLESNPFILEMTFPAPRDLNGFSIIIGEAAVEITLVAYPTPEAGPVTYTFEGKGTRNEPELSFDLPETEQVQGLRVEVRDVNAMDTAKIHIWELDLN